jgi:hypothetical protein
MVSKSGKLRFGACHEKVKWIDTFDEIQLIGGFVEKQHEIKSPT